MRLRPYWTNLVHSSNGSRQSHILTGVGGRIVVQVSLGSVGSCFARPEELQQVYRDVGEIHHPPAACQLGPKPGDLRAFLVSELHKPHDVW